MHAAFSLASRDVIQTWDVASLFSFSSWRPRQRHNWISSHGGVAGRLNWHGAFGGTKELWQKVAKPLLSVGAVGSISAERSSKGLKQDILSLKRNRLSDDQAIVLYRASVNLRHLLKVRLEVNERVANSLLRHVKG